MYEMMYNGKKKPFKDITGLANELLWIWTEDLGLDYIFHSDTGTVEFVLEELEPCQWCGMPVTEQSEAPADYCTHDGNL